MARRRVATVTMAALGLAFVAAGCSSGGEDTVRIYSGYSGWGAGQLEAEIDEGSWYVVPAAPDDPFDRPQGQWSRVLRRQQGHLALLSTYPDDISSN